MISRRFGGNEERGQALVEFALVLMIVLLLMLGVLDFGRAIFASNTTSHAAREATRQASVSPLDCESVYYVVQRHTQSAVSVGVTIEYRKPPASSEQNPQWFTISCPSAYSPTATYDFDPATGALGTLPPSPPAPERPIVDGEVRVIVADEVFLATPVIANIVGGSIDVASESAMKVTYVPTP